MNVFATIRSELKTPRDVWKKNRKLPDQLELFALGAMNPLKTLPSHEIIIHLFDQIIMVDRQNSENSCVQVPDHRIILSI